VAGRHPRTTGGGSYPLGPGLSRLVRPPSDQALAIRAQMIPISA
jgi:hypothetical protein